MLRNVLLPATALAALFLGACNHETAQARLDPLQNAAPALASTIAGMQVLAFSDDGANAKLASMDASAGGAGLLLECEHGGRIVHVTRVGATSDVAAITLSGDGRRSSVAAQPQAFEGRRLLTADVSSDAPALLGFRKSAVLRVEDGARSFTATAENGREGAERFLAACEARA